jgi:hypothetical protein
MRKGSSPDQQIKAFIRMGTDMARPSFSSSMAFFQAGPASAPPFSCEEGGDDGQEETPLMMKQAGPTSAPVIGRSRAGAVP